LSGTIFLNLLTVFKFMIPSSKHIILIGHTCSGKTHLGEAFAHMSHRRFIDLKSIVIKLFKDNHHIDLNEQIDLYQIFDQLGEQVYQAYEHLAIQHALRSFSKQRGILAIGSGTLSNTNNLRLLHRYGRFFYLKNNYRTLHRRWMATEPALKELNRKKKELETYYDQLHNFFSRIADVIFDLNSLDDNECLTALSKCSKEDFWLAYLHREKNHNTYKKRILVKKTIVYTDLDTDRRLPALNSAQAC